MKRILGVLALVVFNLVVIASLLEIGVRGWIYFTKENSSVFENQISEKRESHEKREITGSVSLGKLIQKSSDPGRIYELMPNIEATYLGHHLQTNSFGMRDAFYDLEKKSNTKRVVGIGDSVMFGWGVAEDESYLSLLEKDFASRGGDKVEILNFAVPGYNTAMEVSTYQSLARKFSPDVVVIHFVDNDLTIPLFMEAPPQLFSFKRSFLLEMLSDLNRNLRNRPAVERDLVGAEFSSVDRVRKEQVVSQYKYMVGHEGFKRAAKELARMSCEDGVRVILLTGKLRGWVGKLVRNMSREYGFEVVEVYHVVEKYIVENNIENTPSSRKKLLWLNESDPHPNPLGHKLYAESLRPSLLTYLEPSGSEVNPYCLLLAK